jgi:hypothetical protein
MLEFIKVNLGKKVIRNGEGKDIYNWRFGRNFWKDLIKFSKNVSLINMEGKNS